jgi:hypothetical protein
MNAANVTAACACCLRTPDGIAQSKCDTDKETSSAYKSSASSGQRPLGPFSHSLSQSNSTTNSRCNFCCTDCLTIRSKSVAFRLQQENQLLQQRQQQLQKLIIQSTQIESISNTTYFHRIDQKRRSIQAIENHLSHQKSQIQAFVQTAQRLQSDHRKRRYALQKAIRALKSQRLIVKSKNVPTIQSQFAIVDAAQKSNTQYLSQLMFAILNLHVVRRTSLDACSINGLQLLDSIEECDSTNTFQTQHKLSVSRAERMQARQTGGISKQNLHELETNAALQQHKQIQNRSTQQTNNQQTLSSTSQHTNHDQSTPLASQSSLPFDSDHIAAALGYIVCLVLHLSRLLRVSLPHSMHYCGSTSFIAQDKVMNQQSRQNQNANLHKHSISSDKSKSYLSARPTQNHKSQAQQLQQINTSSSNSQSKHSFEIVSATESADQSAFTANKSTPINNNIVAQVESRSRKASIDRDVISKDVSCNQQQSSSTLSIYTLHMTCCVEAATARRIMQQDGSPLMIRASSSSNAVANKDKTNTSQATAAINAETVATTKSQNVAAASSDCHRIEVMIEPFTNGGYKTALSLLASNIQFLCRQIGVHQTALRQWHLLPNMMCAIQAVQINLAKQNSTNALTPTSSHSQRVQPMNANSDIKSNKRQFSRSSSSQIASQATYQAETSVTDIYPLLDDEESDWTAVDVAAPPV